jgi:hypothetical protein
VASGGWRWKKLKVRAGLALKAETLKPEMLKWEADQSDGSDESDESEVAGEVGFGEKLKC